jgi:hypothetical protein
MGSPQPMLTPEDLTVERFDTVVVASVEPVGRLFGRRVPLRRFLVDGADRYRVPVCTSALVWDLSPGSRRAGRTWYWCPICRRCGRIRRPIARRS